MNYFLCKIGIKQVGFLFLLKRNNRNTCFGNVNIPKVDNSKLYWNGGFFVHLYLGLIAW